MRNELPLFCLHNPKLKDSSMVVSWRRGSEWNEGFLLIEVFEIEGF